MSSITSITKVLQPDQPAPGGRIDLPVQGAVIYGERLEIDGWVSAKDPPVLAVEASIGGKVVHREPPIISRPDLDVRNVGREAKGFFLSLEAPSAPAFEIHLSTILADGRHDPLGVIKGRHHVRQPPAATRLVSVAIPCHNQARFIAAAIDSVLAQTYQHFELVVIDDGSLDDSAAIAEELGIRCIRQSRMGPSAARNTGFYATTGDYVVFLDGDNRLMPYALEANLHAFEDHPESAFVGGRYTYIDESGSRYRGIPVPDPTTPENHYASLLTENYFGSPDNVMFRRSVLEEMGLFDSAVDGLEDYDLYLRIAKDHPVHYHGATVSEYRIHASQFSSDKRMMLRSAVLVLDRHRKLVRKDPVLRHAHRAGLAYWRTAYANALVAQLRAALRFRQWGEAASVMFSLLRWHPLGLATHLRATRRSGRRG